MNSKSLISIVNWNSGDALRECLKGIAKISKSEQPDVVVVDNHSTREAFKIDSSVRESLHSLEVTKNSENLGFAAGHNPNIRKAKKEDYDYIFLLNPDTEIIDADLFQKLADALESNPKALGANPTILQSLNPSTIWYGGGKLSLKTSYASHLQVGKIDNESQEEPLQTGFLTGCCLAISLKRASLEQLLLSEGYFVYWEDTDWSARAIKAGFELLYVPQARLLHHVSDTLGIRSPTYIYYNIRNQFLFIRRNISAFYWPLSWLRVAYITLKYKGNILLKYDKYRFKTLAALGWAWVDGVMNKTGELRRSL